MSSGQVSMLFSSVGSVSSVDSTLRSAPTDYVSSTAASLAVSENETEAEPTAAFISSFNTALAKEISNKPFSSQRQVPAADSNLSDISLTLAHTSTKAAAETELGMASDVTDELLSTNLLQQIALTNSNKTNSAGANAIGDQGNSSDEVKAELALSTDAEQAMTQLLPPSAKAENVEASTSQTSKQLTKAEKFAAAAAMSSKPVLSNGPIIVSDELEPEIKLPAQADNLLAKPNAIKTGDAELLTAITEATGLAEDNAKQAVTSVQTAATDTTEKSATKTVITQPSLAITDTAEAEQMLAEQVKNIAGLGSDKSQSNSTMAASVASSASLTSKAETKNETKTEAKLAAETKSNQLQTDPDKLVAAAKQPDAAAQFTEKLTSMHTATPRSDQGFSATLANAQATAVESRLATATNNLTPTTTHTEQLKQSINLMQQDAAGHMRQQVSLMLSQQIQKAEIRLDPAGLGMMQIKIEMQQDQATVQFTVQQHQAKELIEQQLPRLREMLQQQGIQLAEGQVQQQSQQQQQRQLAQQQQQNQHLAGESTNDEELGMPIQITVKHSERLVDYYA